MNKDIINIIIAAFVGAIATAVVAVSSEFIQISIADSSQNAVAEILENDEEFHEKISESLLERNKLQITTGKVRLSKGDPSWVLDEGERFRKYTSRLSYPNQFKFTGVPEVTTSITGFDARSSGDVNIRVFADKDNIGSDSFEIVVEVSGKTLIEWVDISYTAISKP